MKRCCLKNEVWQVTGMDQLRKKLCGRLCDMKLVSGCDVSRQKTFEMNIAELPAEWGHIVANVSGVYEKNEGKQIYVEGLKRYQKRGIRVLIDGEDASEETWGKLFEVREDGSFYMGDYILEDVVQQKPDSEEVKEKKGDYTKAKRLKEIHFDIVYHQ